MSVNLALRSEVYSVYPGKIKQLKRMITERNLDVLIEIDGGVTIDNAKEIIDAALMLVAGSSLQGKRSCSAAQLKAIMKSRR